MPSACILRRKLAQLDVAGDAVAVGIAPAGRLVLAGPGAEGKLAGAVSSGIVSGLGWLVPLGCVDGDGERDARSAGPMLASRGAGRVPCDCVPCSGVGDLADGEPLDRLVVADEVVAGSLDSLPGFGAGGSGIADGIGRGGGGCPVNAWSDDAFSSTLPWFFSTSCCTKRSSRRLLAVPAGAEGRFGALAGALVRSWRGLSPSVGAAIADEFPSPAVESELRRESGGSDNG